MLQLVIKDGKIIATHYPVNGVTVDNVVSYYGEGAELIDCPEGFTPQDENGIFKADPRSA